MPTPEFYKPKDVTEADLAFGGEMKELLPTYDKIPQEFKDGNTKWNVLVSKWFFFGLKNAKWTPKEGIETKKALAHLQAILVSFEPKHEHKEAGVAYLMSLWFLDAEAEPAKDLAKELGLNANT